MVIQKGTTLTMELIIENEINQSKFQH